MPFKGEAKRRYQQRYMALRRAHGRSGGESERGVRPRHAVRPMLDPDYKKEMLDPQDSGWFPMIDARRKYQAKFLEYILYLNEGGMRLVKQGGVFYLAPQPVDEMLKRVAVLEMTKAERDARLDALEARQGVLATKVALAYQRNTILEAEVARLDVMINSLLREGTEIIR